MDEWISSASHLMIRDRILLFFLPITSQSATLRLTGYTLYDYQRLVLAKYVACIRLMGSQVGSDICAADILISFEQIISNRICCSSRLNFYM